MKKLALKRLTQSDLTLFEWQFRNRNAGNQKAINLNADVFVEILFPALPEVAAGMDGRIPVDLFLYGPSGASELNLQRKIIKWGSYKNWRLDGETIHNPSDALTRFNELSDGDFAVIEFNEGVYPTRAKVVLLARGSAVDAAIHASLEPLLGTKSMVPLTENALQEAIAAAGNPEDHPIQELILTADLEDAVLGSADAMRRFRRKRTGRRILRSELLAAKRQADENGQRGEEFVNQFLQSRFDEATITEFEWISRDDPYSPYDFSVTETAGQHGVLDVKATSGEFERRIHISTAELEEMANAESYSVYRVYGMDGAVARLRIANRVKDFAKAVLTSLATLPKGVNVDSIAIDPSVLEWGAEITLYLPSPTLTPTSVVPEVVNA